MSARDDDTPAATRPTFYTVAETARLLRVDPATIYRAIREDAFPAVRVRSRYVIPAVAVEQMADQAAETGTCIDVAAIATGRRGVREVARIIGGRV
ncbi:MAG: helix-turn-helix domain-containing protein [Pseudonocardia sp.]